jgi:catechol 2,3-dioxygenase-like lactoylglutathione lyase family enzyme
VELALGTHGRSAGQHDAWASVFGQVDAGGYYKPRAEVAARVQCVGWIPVLGIRSPRRRTMRVDIDDLVGQFESRRLSRRELVAALAGLVAAATPAAAQSGQTTAVAQARTINHVSLAVTDVEKSAAFYKALLGLKEVSRPGNGGINLGLGTSFLGVYKLANPGTVNHFCLGVDDFDPDVMAERLKQQGIQATVDRNPANRTSGGDQLYFTDPDKTRVQLGANGYQG